MRKSTIILVIGFIFTLFGCGNDYAKINGISAQIMEDGHYSNELLLDRTTQENNVYILEVGKTYILYVDYSYGGGSRIPMLEFKDTTLNYDHKNINITENPESQSGVEYIIFSEQAIEYSAIIIETKDYVQTIIVSFR